MSIRYQEEESASPVLPLTLGALAGFAVGMIVAQRFGGLTGIGERLRGRFGHTRALPYDNFGRGAAVPIGADDTLHAEMEDGLDDAFDDELDTADEEAFDAALEERVLEAFRNDPVLAECAIDIGALGDGIVELAGMVDTDAQARHAVTIARGVPEVETIVNRMVVGMDESRFQASAGRASGDGSPGENARWEGQQVGTGRRRQGTSDEPDRHADPKPELEDRWLAEEEAVANAADDIAGAGNRHAGGKRGGRGSRTSGAPLAPTGVPKADHVARDREKSIEVQEKPQG